MKVQVVVLSKDTSEEKILELIGTYPVILCSNEDGVDHYIVANDIDFTEFADFCKKLELQCEERTVV